MHKKNLFQPFYVKSIGFFLGIILFILVWMLVDFGAEHSTAKFVAAVAALMACWWIFESVPLAATSLVPLIFFPLLGVVNATAIADKYMNSTIMLFIGGFFIAIAMEKWNLHKRIALSVILFFGSSPSKIIFGFMAACAFISMWISNTATCLMVLPIGLSIVYKVEDEFGKDKTAGFSKSLMLAIAYSCTIGGIATLIGTPPNLIFQRMYKISFPSGELIKFGEWMVFAVPLSFVLLILTWVVLTKVFYRTDRNLVLNREIIREEKTKLGITSYEEKAVSLVFFITSFLWIFRSDLDLGILKIPGWSNLFSVSAFIDDSMVAISMALVLFLIPCDWKTNKHKFILDYDDVKKVPWDIVLLFGGGFALAEGFVQSGLSKILSQSFIGLTNLSPIAIIALISFIVVFATELLSNSALITIMLPVLASLAIEMKVDPIMFMVPATISVSLAFMLQVGTPPNAIVFSSRRLTVFDMAKTGFLLNWIGIVLVVTLAYLFFVK
ncbi:MAG: SLC13/DASS family transporter [Ignavibacteria bacterium]|nr:SLC13/DASS family transporter [Ignavibacteria bacterium]